MKDEGDTFWWWMDRAWKWLRFIWIWKTEICQKRNKSLIKKKEEEDEEEPTRRRTKIVPHWITFIIENSWRFLYDRIPEGWRLQFSVICNIVEWLLFFIFVLSSAIDQNSLRFEIKLKKRNKQNHTHSHWRNLSTEK